MKENLIKVKTAELAKEKFFDIFTFNYYDDSFLIQKYDDKSSVLYLAPTQSLLQKWLREVHNINVIPFAQYSIQNNTVKYYYHFLNGLVCTKEFETKTFEEAFELGLIEGLKKIK